MNKHSLWPLLPPLVIALALSGFLALNRLVMKGYGFECGIKKSLGVYCPGCGGTRCAKEIVNGNWLAAMNHNAMLMSGFILLTTFMLFLIIRITILGMPAPKIPAIKTKWVWFGITGIALFTILRNIPYHPWALLAP